MSNIKILSDGEYNTLSSFEEEGKKVYNMKSCYKAYVHEMTKAINIIESLTNEVEELKKAKKKIPKEFNHTIDKRLRNKAIKLLKDQRTVKYVAAELGISESTVNRIKKDEGLATPMPWKRGTRPPKETV